jgi:hypothetical protein
VNTGEITEMSKTPNKVTETYKNRNISFEEKPDNNKIVVQIGEKSIEVIRKGDRYYSLYLPYATHSSVSELAKNIIDRVPGFS